MSFAYDESDKIFGDDYQESIRAKLSSTRYKIAFLGFLGFSLTFSMREVISLAIVAMATEQKTKDDSYSENCPVPGNESQVQRNETKRTFDWTPTEEAYLLSGFFYGYLLPQIPFGYLTSIYGGKTFFGLGLLLRSILLMLNPPVAYLGE